MQHIMNHHPLMLNRSVLLAFHTQLNRDLPYSLLNHRLGLEPRSPMTQAIIIGHDLWWITKCVL